ncbi:MAG: glycosyl hydrolase [Bacteroidales bacterium]
MKPFRVLFFSILGFILMITGCQRQGSILLREKFKHPSSTEQVRVWWHWMDGNITKEGITRDLEAMKQQGVSQATVLNVGLFGGKDFGIPRVKFNSPEWYDMFRWAVQEADRLGIVLGAHNCDGWSSSGGPWITPEISMKQYVWSKTIVTGGKKISVQLQKPWCEKDFYRDVAVVAVKTNEIPGSFQTARPKITVISGNNLNASTDVFVRMFGAGNKGSEVIPGDILADGNPLSAVQVGKGYRIEFAFQQPFHADKIVIHPRMRFSWSDISKFVSQYSLWGSDNGRSYKEITRFDIKGLNESVGIEIPPSEFRFYLLQIDDITDPGFLPFTIAEAELLKAEEKPLFAPVISSFMAKTVSSKAGSMYDFDGVPAVVAAENYPQMPNTIDVTAFMNSEGLFSWDAPNGNWAILRFGYTTTGAVNAPATPEGTGLECDKMDTVALNVHFENFPARLIKEAGSLAGSTFRYIFIDSWECGYQNWTGNFPAEFEKRRGYNIMPWLPVLCGMNVAQPEQMEAFLYDFRKTIAELIEENYYKHFSQLCHRLGMDFHAEVIYGGVGYPPLDILRANSYADLPMFEFWAGHNQATSFPEYTPAFQPEYNFPAFAAAMYNKPVMAAESYTAQAHYSESPWDLKCFGDRAYCSGINQFILHSYVHQPFDRKPGMTLLLWGSHFNRNNLYWEHLSDWLTYHARIQAVLQNGRQVARLLAYTGDQQPQALDFLTDLKLPFGYPVSVCNQDILISKTKEKKNKILCDGLEYDLLILPPASGMNLATLEAIEKLVKQGANLYGPRPKRLLSLKDEPGKKEFDIMTARIWGPIDGKNYTENKYGKGKVYWGKPLPELLKKINIFPEFETGQPDSLKLMFIHKKTETADVFFLFNQTDSVLVRKGIFSTSARSPEIWNPVDGTIMRPAVYRYLKDGRICLPLSLKPRESMLVVFTGTNSGKYIESVYFGKDQIFPSADRVSSLPHAPVVWWEDNKIKSFSAVPGEYVMRYAGGKTISVKLSSPDTFCIENVTGTLSFSSSYPADIKSIEITRLASWSESTDPAIKYFSGTGTYHLKFSVPEEYLAGNDSVLLSLGEIGSTARVTLNNQHLGYVWNPFIMLPVRGILSKENELEVEVNNVYRNRIIGDYIEKGKVSSVWTSAPVELYLDKNKPLKKSGLLGPIKLIRISSTVL